MKGLGRSLIAFLVAAALFAAMAVPALAAHENGDTSQNRVDSAADAAVEAADLDTANDGNVNAD